MKKLPTGYKVIALKMTDKTHKQLKLKSVQIGKPMNSIIMELIEKFITLNKGK